MIQFTKLRLHGFKSFVERTEFDIGPGLNGIVGPNGCGKSNIVEALRWIMGENSAKRMRGGEMDDVIFTGSTARTARNVAEVSLLLDNSARTAPAAYNGSDEIEVVRRIEREHGSSYKINGKNVRARDVQLLFADSSIGANSPAMVSQGRVAQIINSKPHDRRIILEESAGISGLYARRHEAELRLKAADANMLRVEDVLNGMEGRLNALKRQARQATRYKNVNAQIRQLELLIAWLDWRALEKRIENAREILAQTESAVTERLAAVTQQTKAQTMLAENVTPLRMREAEIAAALQTKKIALQRIEDEAARLEQSLREAQEQMDQALLDQSHEKEVTSECSESMDRLEKEQAALSDEQDSDAGQLEAKKALRDQLEDKVVKLEEQHTAMMQSAAESRARRQSLEQQIKTNAERIDTIRSRKAKAEADLGEMSSERDISSQISGKESAIRELEAALSSCKESAELALKEVDAAQRRINESSAELARCVSKRSEFNSEIAMLESLLQEGKALSHSPVINLVNAEAGFEKALSRALGDALLAGLEDGASARWSMRRNMRSEPSLPGGIQPLLGKISAPRELTFALSQIGLVRNDDEGEMLADELAPGQSLVSPDGTYWRWDGYRIKADAADRNAIYLEQKNRLEELRKKGPLIESEVSASENALQSMKDALIACEEKRRTFVAEIASAEGRLNAEREALSALREKQARAESETSRLQDIIRLSEEDIQTLDELTRWDRERLKAYEHESEGKKDEDAENLRKALAEARDAHNAAVRAFETFEQQKNSRSARLRAIADERINLQNRLIRSRERLKQLEARQESMAAKIMELNSQPHDFEKEKETLLNQVSELESARGEAAENLAACEREVAEVTRSLKEAENGLSESREARAAAQATHAALEEQRVTMSQAVMEQFSVAPADLPGHAAIEMQQEDTPESLESLRARKEKLARERDNLGAVNLRADEEAAQLESEFTAVVNERNDLSQAIEELRGAISKINKEARERLLAAFEHVNGHFQTLFTRLFGGGQAHLSLIDSDDPLGAGLEIFAQPPGKALQSLSLLSGGEQALTSIALIFAMFLTNPSPVCVLDEIDAPLDDANVDRVCGLLEDIAARGETRFIIITHHRLTMARMNRLYGVTMAEKGVSQLVSVDLQRSFEFAEAA